MTIENAIFRSRVKWKDSHLQQALLQQTFATVIFEFKHIFLLIYKRKKASFFKKKNVFMYSFPLLPDPFF